MRNLWLIPLALLALIPLALSQRSGSPAPALIPGGEWFNSAPTTLADQQGKVVLVNFWTFGCYNCDNSLPALRDYYGKYKDKGLEIIGVHTPEFDYEKVADNVKEAIQKKGITWPVVQDNAFKTWRAYSNRYWPAFYLIDRKGTIRYVQTGEISPNYPSGIKRLEDQIVKVLGE
jgi:thiol-disulfide isomerase/thioredoxin